MFISSVFEGLHGLRAELVAEISKLPDWAAWAAEAHGADPSSTREVLRRHIDASDVVVVLAARRYGSLITDLGISYTEFEVRCAVAARKPLLIYYEQVARGSSDAARLRNSLLTILKDDLIGAYSVPIELVGLDASARLAVCTQVTDDLRQRRIQGWKISSLPQRVRDVLTGRAPGSGRHRVDVDHFVALLDRLDATRIAGRYADAVALAATLEPDALSLAARRSDRARQLLAQYLDTYAHVAGISASRPASVGLAKVAFAIQCGRDDWAAASGIAQNVSGLLNMFRFGREALAWNDFVASRPSSLDVAIAALDSRAHILRDMGRHGEAAKLEREAVGRYTYDDETHAYMLASLGGMCVGASDPRGADHAFALSEPIAGDGLTRSLLLRERLRGATPTEAPALVRESREICARHGLWHPLAEIMQEAERLGVSL